ncbi:ABC transporter ATP-binding protein [Stenotrophomonas sp.]|uniref:ABC transporter ATP-binding protein n=1 Tax=Stenotrophomonas sp. TaxID=69392 RepID=UPI0028ADA10A|nr:ABC transporter ATP-binding protein [Stenotrophomonas sp.]
MTSTIICNNVGKSFPLGRREPVEVLRQQLFGTSATYRDPFWALRNVNFEVGAGEALAVVGRNGSGKSTLLQILTGVLPPSEGSVSVNGKIAALLELGSGFDPEYTGRENVYMNGAVLGLSERQIDKRFSEIEKFADIGRFIDEPVRVYSSGMFVRLAFSVAIHVDPEILVVDEALSVGDARFAAKCMRRIRDLREGGVTLLFVSHDISSVRAVCDRALWLSDGRTRMLGSVFEVTAHYMEYLFEDEVGTDSSRADGESAAEPESVDTSNPAEDVVDPQIDSSLHAEAAGGQEAADGMHETPFIETAGAIAVSSQAEDESSIAARVDGIVNHWGSHVGCIRGVRISNQGGNSTVLNYGDEVVIEVDLLIPDEFPRDSLSLAFSIKDLRGTDLLVCTTHDENKGIFSGVGGAVTVRYRFTNRLSPGKFLLVLALEDRFAPVISYYEYIEGVAYFASISEVDRFGIFNLPVAVTIEGA